MSYPRPQAKRSREEIPSLYPQKKQGIKIYQRDLKVIMITVFFYTVLIFLVTL